jgi:putative sigma-54 modulation protein
MRITVKGKNVNVTDALEKYAQKKIEKLDRYFHNIKEAVVTQSVQRNWHIVEVTLEGDGILLRGEERSDNMYHSIDAVVDKLEKQLKRFKGKLIERAHPAESPKEHISSIPEESAAGEQAPAIVRTKKLALKPMPPEEAAMQMEMIDHDFFLFLNSDTDTVGVIYRRQDGNYGVLEPEA